MRVTKMTKAQYDRKLGRLPTREELLRDSNLSFAFGSIGQSQWRKQVNALGETDWREAYAEATGTDAPTEIYEP